MRKKYILDTSVLLNDCNALTSFNGNDIILPMIILEEIDKHKSGFTNVAMNARNIIRKLDDYSKLGEIHKGVNIDNDINLKIDIINYDISLSEKNYGDNKILACAQYYSQKNKKDKIIIVSCDINLRIKARALGLDAEDYRKDMIATNRSELYTGHKEIIVTSEEVDLFYLNNEKILTPEQVQEHGLYLNQYITLIADNDPEKFVYAKFKNSNILKPISVYRNLMGITHKNREQAFALDMLMDPEIKLITINGMAGTGKSLLSLAAALEQILHHKRYDKLFIAKALTTVGASPGALPGTLYEKLNPFLGSVIDCINILFSNNKKNAKDLDKKSNGRTPREDDYVFDDPYLALLVQNKVIQIDALAYLRGRSIPNSIMFFDELQNQNVETVKTILTRAAHNTKIICCGDADQIDQVNLNLFNNGLTHLIEKFKGQAIYGHITLTQGERSEIATLAAQLL